MITTAPSAAEASTGSLRGAPAARGHATGRARIARTPEDAELLQPGEILVCAALTPSMMPLISRASGVIAERGGALSNAATIAREYGIPAVIGVPGATAHIRTGQPITIDGSSGIIGR